MKSKAFLKTIELLTDEIARLETVEAQYKMLREAIQEKNVEADCQDMAMEWIESQGAMPEQYDGLRRAICARGEETERPCKMTWPHESALAWVKGVPNLSNLKLSVGPQVGDLSNPIHFVPCSSDSQMEDHFHAPKI